MILNNVKHKITESHRSHTPITVKFGTCNRAIARKILKASNPLISRLLPSSQYFNQSRDLENTPLRKELKLPLRWSFFFFRFCVKKIVCGLFSASFSRMSSQRFVMNYWPHRKFLHFIWYAIWISRSLNSCSELELTKCVGAPHFLSKRLRVGSESGTQSDLRGVQIFVLCWGQG